MLPLIAMGVGVMGGIFQGLGANAAARRQEEQARQQWMQGEFQKAINNGKELFRASYMEEQQLNRNAAIQKAAYQGERDALEVNSDQRAFASAEMGNTYRQMQGAIAAKLAQSGIRGGTASALEFSQSTNFLRKAMQSDKNFKLAEKNIARQRENMMNQQRFDLIMPNLQLPSAKPLGAPSGALNIVSGALGGISSGLGGMASLYGAGFPMTGNPFPQ